jgi:catechol 2,3-dioxygenase-like lactoylglutathione lyase family enzyme
MITGIHALIYTKDADKDRAFFRDVLGFKGVDAGEGWLIFKLPPAELGVHPADDASEFHELYLMCDDVKQTVGALAAKGITCTAVHDEGWGLVTMVTLPGGSKMGMYQPRHPTAIGA